MFYVLQTNIQEEEMLLFVKTLHCCHKDKRGLDIFVSLIMEDRLCVIFFRFVANQPFAVGKFRGKTCRSNTYLRCRVSTMCCVFDNSLQKHY
jgi:hypothetical protein